LPPKRYQISCGSPALLLLSDSSRRRIWPDMSVTKVTERGRPSAIEEEASWPAAV
jgi:hypothetical protein